MKQFSIGLILLALVAGWLAPLPASAQDANKAAAIAAQQEAEERYKLMASDLQNLVASNEAMQKRMTALQKEVRALQEENAKLQQAASVRYVTQDELQIVVKALKELDVKREDDKKLILREVEKMARAVSQPVPPPPTPRAKPPQTQDPKPETPPTVEDEKPIEGFPHIVQKGETLSVIIKAYNDQLKEQGAKERITMESVQKANPKLKPERMYIGQRIILPDPRKKN